MPVPTPEQLEKINRFAVKPLSAEQVYVFPDLLIDDQLTAYHSKIHPRLLEKFVRDANQGVGLLMNHNNRQLPVGRSFESDMRTEYDEELDTYVTSVYASFYIDLGRQTQSGMTTDDIAKGIDAGTIFDTSIGFSANSWECSICGNDIRDWVSCSHFPGEKYVVNRNGEDVVEQCYVIVGSDGKGELLENSLVYAGACNRATIKRNFSAGGDVSESPKGSKLHLVEDFKNIPLTATIYQYYTKDGSVLFTDTDERTNGSEELKRRSEQTVEFEKFKEVLDQFGIKANTPDELSQALQALQTAGTELSNAKGEIEKLTAELATANTELEEVRGQLANKDATIAELTKVNEQLTEKAGLADTYRRDLMNKALELGVRAQGNAFNTTMYERFLGTLSVDEIKEVIAGFEKEVQERFGGARITDGSKGDSKRRFNNEPQSRADFDSDIEFRNFVAEKATEYAKEHGVSIAEATKLMYKKYSKEDGSEE